MKMPEDIEGRLNELEIKLALTDEWVDRLNEIVAAQQTRIDLLMREVARLGRERADGEATVTRSLFDDVPPHY